MATRTRRLTEALVTGEDLPGEWEHFDPESAHSDTNLCGEPQSRPDPESSALTAWAVTPDDGPIFGERLEQFGDQEQAAAVLDQTLDLPCTFTTDDGAQWRTEIQPPPTVGDDGRVYLVTSVDRPDSYKYEVAIVSNDIAFRAVLNTRKPDRELLDELVTIAWTKAKAEGVVE